MRIIPDDKRLPLLVGMKELLSDPDHWFKGQYSNAPRPSQATSDACYCTLGAGAKVAYDLGINTYDAFGITAIDRDVGELLISCGPDKVYEYADDRPFAEIVDWNDSEARTHDEVITALDCAIAKLEG